MIADESKNSTNLSEDVSIQKVKTSEPFYFTIPFNDVDVFLEKSGTFNKKYAYYIKHNLMSAIDKCNEIIKSKENDEHINENRSDSTLFGFKNQNFTQPVKKCEIEIKDIRYLKKSFARIRAYCCRNTKKRKFVSNIQF